MSVIAPVTLRGWGVELRPLSLTHVPGLQAAVSDGDIWKLAFTSAPEPTPEAVTAYVEKALAHQAEGTHLPFAVVGANGDVLGTTRYYDLAPSVCNLAIGYTWYAARVQRTHVNTACKRLLLGHAFDALDAEAVYFHTSHLNLRSRAAIERLGAKLDGVIRRHQRHKDGSLRDTYSYSIVREEWPAIREALDARLKV